MRSNDSHIIREMMKKLPIEEEECKIIIEKAREGKEISVNVSIEEWLSDRFLPNCTIIDKLDYSKMCIDALKILNKTAASDFGSSRQRDLGQLWADMTRGYLGEQAFANFLMNKYNFGCALGHEVGELDDFLPMDIHTIIDENGEERKPKINISIKTSKLNGIWMDIPGDQFNHSDIHVFVKVGTGRDHLFAFFKDLSVFKDKVLMHGEKNGLLNSHESNQIFEWLPTFKPIIAYICGFVSKSDRHDNLDYKGKKGRKNFTIEQWNGEINPGDLEKIRIRENVELNGKISFKSIGSFNHDKGFLFNTGNLKWRKEDWTKMIGLI